MKTRLKFFSDYYDSVFQRLIFEANEKEKEINDLIIGRLRFDTLLSKKIILTDAMIMDGPYFLFSTPLDLKKDLLRSDRGACPIEIKTRKNKIEDATVGFLKDEKKQIIKRFAFSIIRDEKTRNFIMREFQNENFSSINDIGSIINKFREYGLNGFDPENLKRIKHGWEKWIAACNDEQFAISKWKGEFDLLGQLGDKSEVINLYSTDVAVDIIKTVYKKPDLRSENEATILSKLKTAVNDHEKKEIRGIANWYFSSYSCTLNSQHGCDNFESIYSTTDNILTPGVELNNDTFLAIPVNVCDFFYGLGTLPRAEYRSLFNKKNKDNLNKWWNEGNLESLEAALDPFIEKSLSSSGLISDQKKKISYAQIAIMGVAGFTTGAFGGCLASLSTGITNVAAPLVINYCQNYKRKKLIKNVSQRTMDIAIQRGKDEEEN